MLRGSDWAAATVDSVADLCSQVSDFQRRNVRVTARQRCLVSCQMVVHVVPWIWSHRNIRVKYHLDIGSQAGDSTRTDHCCFAEKVSINPLRRRCMQPYNAALSIASYSLLKTWLQTVLDRPDTAARWSPVCQK